MTFGEFFRQKRISLGLTLRKFCETYQFDPGNISKLERNILSPSLDEEKLAGYATALRIKRDSEEWVTFFDLAHAAKNTIPKDVTKNGYDFLPAFFRTMRNKNVDRGKMKELIDFLNDKK